jgi:intracellular multiplication protein IcmT
MAQLNVRAHWRDSARSARFFVIDARSALPCLLLLVHIRWWTFWTFLGVTIFFAILERFGFTMIVFARLARSLLAGPRKLCRPWWREDKLM